MYENLIKRLQRNERLLGELDYAPDGPSRQTMLDAIRELDKLDRMIAQVTEEFTVSIYAAHAAKAALDHAMVSEETTKRVAEQIQAAIRIGYACGKPDGAASRAKPDDTQSAQAKLQAGMELAKVSLAANNQLPADPLNFEQLRHANAKRCKDTYHHDDWTAIDRMVCVVAEVGELAHLLKHARRGIKVDTSMLANEIADIAIYLDLLAGTLGIDLGAAVARKFNVTSHEANSDVTLPWAGKDPVEGDAFFVI